MDGVLGRDDQSLLAAAARGDVSAFASIVTAYDGDMRRVAFLVSGDLDVSEEAVQAAWLIAWRKLDRLRDPDRLRPWLVSIAANEARQLLRRQRRSRVREVVVDDLAGTVARPPDHVGLERQMDLLQALSHLSPEDRAIVAMRYIMGMTSAEIGREIRMNPASVRSRLARALVRLREDLGDV